MNRFTRLMVLIVLLCCSAPVWPQDSGWTPCGQEGGDCRIPTADAVTVRFGSGNSYALLEVQGGVVDCNVSVFGDPAINQAKTCAYNQAESSGRKWQRCATEGAACVVPGDLPRYVRYGAGQHWIIKVASGRFSCGNAEFHSSKGQVYAINGLFPDIAPNVAKQCEVSNVLPLAARGGKYFDNCGSEGNACSIQNDSGTILVRFGDGGSQWVYMTASAPSLSCGIDTFVFDPAQNIHKFCQVASFPTITSVSAKWVEEGQNRGGGALHQTVTSGIEGARQKSSSETFKKELTTKIEAGNENVKVSAEFKLGHETSTAIAETLTRSDSTSKTVDCPPGHPESALYQWVVSVDESCYTLATGCHSDIRTFRTLCVADLPRGMVPTVPPGRCADVACTVSN